MRRAFAVAVVVLGLLGAALLVATDQLSTPKFDAVLEGAPEDALAVAPADEALTLARTGSGGDARVWLVVAARGGALEAVDLEAAFGRPYRDAVEAFVQMGYDALARAAADADRSALSLDDLVLPFDDVPPHVAAGTNFRAHAEEVGRDDGPFLFPKLSAATPWNADVPHRGRLDYEAELCAVTLTAHTAERPARLGFVLCNDFTDRWTLVRDIDLDGPMGQTGFPDGKGGEGMLPIGPWLVVPRDPAAFTPGLPLELYVNGHLRQRDLAGRMIWSPAEIAERALESCDAAYERRAGTVELTDCAGIPARTLLLTGTPAGVMFHPLTLWSPGAYLVPGDEVVTRSPRLGLLRNRIR